MRARLGVALALAAALVAAPSASSAPLCNLVTDKSGDHALVVQGTGAAIGPDLDIRSADVASDRKYVVGAIRLASLQRFDPRYPAARQYELRFRVDDAAYTLNAVVGVVESFAWMSGGGGNAAKPATLSLDFPRAEVRIAVPVAQFGKPPVYRRELTDIVVTSAQYYFGGPRTIAAGPVSTSGNFGNFGVRVDEASTLRTYRGGTPTCVAMPG